MFRHAVLACCLVAAPAGVAARTDVWTRLERIDVTPSGGPSMARGVLSDASISDDGRWVVFASDASDLVADDSNGRKDVFVRDRKNGVTRRLSLRSNGAQTAFDSSLPAASADGRFVTFLSYDGGIVVGDTNSTWDRFLLDRDSDGNGVFDEPGTLLVERISVNDAGAQMFNGADLVRAAVSDRGTTAAFATLQAIDAGDDNGKRDVYLRDRATSRTRLASRSTAGIVGDGESPDFFRPAIGMSGDGARIVFSSSAGNLAGGDSGADVDVFLRDRDSDGNGVLDETGATSTTRLSVDAGGGRLALGAFAQFDFSRDGRWFAIAASDVAGANPAGTDVWLLDIAHPPIAKLPFDAGAWAKGGSAGCCGNERPLVGRGGDVVAFTSSQSYVFGATLTAYGDVFVQARGRELTRLTDFPLPAALGDGYSAGAAALSASGAWLLVGFHAPGAPVLPEEGVYVYLRDTIFEDGLELR